GDMILWDAIRSAIDELRRAGVSSLRVLDAGCGPGTWVRRIAAYANRLGLSSTLRIFLRSKTCARPEDTLLCNDAERLVQRQDGAAEGSCWRPLLLPR